ncbi:putative psp1 domain-containing protein [Erysiphe neolycopersici]|uniref:Putative psp1 domain-containing protein n=1 Tax=Erysiphe neolycopersici TaxID=212602 RepID=A0A420I5X0_9PEZI|nr:putative psp1 domain-containing protein [Erysiphe neolycopersici]
MDPKDKSDRKREMFSTVEVSQNNTPMPDHKPEKRQLTPDSEALISSDDEGDRTEPHWYTQINLKPMPNANRFNETKSNLRHARKASFASSSLSPTNSNLSTPSTDAGIWAHQTQRSSSISRGHPGPSKFAWSNGIWNTDTRIEPPPRLTEVFPTSDLSGSLITPSNDANKDQLANPTIPFPIPLHPTPKTYRSQSYSVGQLDPESPASIRPHISLGSGGRGRMFQHVGLQHRPSRPSMLSEMSNEGILGNVNEVDNDNDNDERKEKKIHRTPLVPNKTQAFEVLSRERGSLQKQQAYFRSRYEVSGDNVFSDNLSGALLDELDSAIEELDDANENQADSSLKEIHGRRFSEISFNNIRAEKYFPIENRKLENVKKAFWQSSLGFGGLDDVSQSRRHSFAEIPTHHIAIGSRIEQTPLQDNAIQEIKPSKEYQNKYTEQKGHSFNDNNISYYDGKSTFSNKLANIQYHQSARSCTMQAHYRGARSGSPHNVMYSASQSRQNQLLTIVIFKFSRPDIFYVQEGIGLSINPGDKVIVEADRGTDLGTVARTNIDWATAKEIRDHYSKEHYTWLSLNSQTRQRPPEGNSTINSTSSGNFQGSSSRALDLSGQHSIQESNSSDLKPKLIKRLAQKHEVDALREKEASEAKAKHVCAQKVQEHGLNMDILDAEFQMDLKKLTFYYFADSYINFNSLVTDLFKIYKTRIWMFAINPASFLNSSLGLQSSIPLGLGISSVPSMIKPALYSPISEQMKSPCSLQASRTLQNSYSQQLTPPFDRPFNSFTTPQFMFGLPAYPGVNSRNSAVPSSSIVSIDHFVGFTPQSDFRRHPTHFSSQNFTLSSPESNFRQGIDFNQNEPWIKSFNGLSMNSR